SAIRGDAIWRDGHCSASVRPGSLPAPEAAALKTALETAAAILRRSKGLAAKTPTKASATLGSAIGLGSRRRAKSLAAEAASAKPSVALGCAVLWGRNILAAEAASAKPSVALGCAILWGRNILAAEAASAKPSVALGCAVLCG